MTHKRFAENDSDADEVPPETFLMVNVTSSHGKNGKCLVVDEYDFSKNKDNKDGSTVYICCDERTKNCKMRAKIDGEQLVWLTNAAHTHDRNNARIMTRLKSGAKIKLLDGAPQIKQKYQKYLLGRNDKRKSSDSQSPVVPAKKSKGQEIELDSEISSASQTPVVPAKKSKRNEIESKGDGSKDKPSSDFCEFKLSFADGKRTSIQEAINKKNLIIETKPVSSH